MIITFALVFLALLALLVLIRLAKGRAFPARSGQASLAQVHPVDIQAFRNLTDPAEEEFLRQNLPPAEFKKVQRERLRAAVDYISCAAANAAILVRVGESARRSPVPEVAEAGEKLVDSAIRLRIYAFQALAKLYVAILFPAAQISPAGLAENYERMTRVVFLLGRLRHSTGPASSAS
ncbi:MAG TPA: hypothetical protein VMH85_05845 [Terriglobales bacterium]|nr:hypothetical protein [Terriglobales bacterium]